MTVHSPNTAEHDSARNTTAQLKRGGAVYRSVGVHSLGSHQCGGSAATDALAAFYGGGAGGQAGTVLVTTDLRADCDAGSQHSACGREMERQRGPWDGKRKA